FAAHAGDVGELGWLVPNHLVRRAAWEAVQGQQGLHVLDNSALAAVQAAAGGVALVLADGERLSARLLVASDSRFSQARRLLGSGARRRDDDKCRRVCRMRHERPNHLAAWEWLGYGLTMALLPLHGDRAGVVLTLPPRREEELMAMDEAAFGAAITDC